jgi:ABC-2 type transport system ATP-binding protein
VNPSVIEVTGIAKVYGAGPRAIRALDGISFQVREGEIFGLIGADGAGKTTAFQILAGVMEATAGTANILGRPARDSRDSVGYLTQRFSLYPDLSIDENLRYSAGLHRVPADLVRERADRFLETFGLAPFRSRLAGRLSGGMKQKLALTCALVSNPKVLLLDEPTTGVDPVSRRDFWDALATLAAEGITMLVATPYLDEAERCHRVALMERGRILAIDTPRDLRSRNRWSRLQLDCGRLAEADALLKQQASENIVDVQRFGDRLELIVNDPAAGEAHVRETLAPAGIPIHALSASAPTLENAFVAALRRLRGAEHHPPFPERRPSPPHEEALLHAEGLTKLFGAFVAVKNFHLTIRPGEIYGLLGANGAGKTTAIKMMCGLLSPSAGQVSLLGHTHALRKAAVRRRIGYMSQKFTLYDDLTIDQNLDFYASIYGVPDHLRRRRKAWILEVADLAGQENLLTAVLPGGWKQRVAFGAAIMHEPDLVFLDEPTSGVDPLARRTMWRMINELADAGAGVLVVTHYLEEAEQCTRLGFMAAGEILLDGSPTQVRSRFRGSILTIETVQTARAYSLLRDRFGRSRVALFGDRIHLRTNGDECSPEGVRAVLSGVGIDVRGIAAVRPSLEDVFIGLIEERRLEIPL